MIDSEVLIHAMVWMNLEYIYLLSACIYTLWRQKEKGAAEDEMSR